MEQRESRLLKQQEVGGGFSPEDYTVERLWATAPDGVRVPMTLLYRKGLQRDGSAPALLYGYGSYGVTLDAHFSVSVLSLVDRGFVYVQAQVRGGVTSGSSGMKMGSSSRRRIPSPTSSLVQRPSSLRAIPLLSA